MPFMPKRPKFGSIYRLKWKKPDGTVMELPTWWISYYENGVKRRESSHSAVYGDAERLLRQRIVEMEAGQIHSGRIMRVTVGDLLDDLLEDYRINEKSVEWAGYVDGHLRKFFGKMKASLVGTAAINRYIADRKKLGRANATINRELALLRHAFNLGKNAVPPLVNVVPRIPALQENNVRKGFFTHDQFTRLRAALPEELRPVITFAYNTGCRKGEILALRWNQVDLGARVVRLEPGETKNDDARTIPLTGELYESLALLKQQRDAEWPECELVFTRGGKQIKSFKGAWAAATERAGMVGDERLFHDLRRTGVRNLIRAGVPELVAMKISGHKTRSVLDRYNIVDERDILTAGAKLENYHATLESTRQEANQGKREKVQ